MGQVDKSEFLLFFHKLTTAYFFNFAVSQPYWKLYRVDSIIISLLSQTQINMKISTSMLRILSYSLVGCLFGFFLSCGSNDEELFIPEIGDSDFTLVINEINAGGNPYDWIEIYNPGTEMVQLEGFYLFDDHTNKYQIPLGFAISAGGYMLFIADEIATGQHTNFRLSSGGAQVVLEDPLENVVDFIDYPLIRGGQAYGRFPDGSTTMFITGTQSPEESNGSNPGPVLEKLNRDIAVPTQDQTVSVSLDAFHQQGQITDIQLFYRLDGGTYDSTAMVLNGDTTYVGTIPSTGMDAIVEYYTRAIDQNGLSAYRPAGAPDSADTYTIDSTPLPQLVINEFLAVNDACCSDTDGELEEFDDWIEIYNTGDDAVDIGGFHLSDSPDDPFKHMIPDSQPSLTTIPAGGYLLIWADRQSEQGTLHADIRLSSQGETVGLYYIDGRTIDDYEFGLQESDISMGRSPDGSSNWVSISVPTPGSANLTN